MNRNEIIQYLRDNRVGIITNSFNPELLNMSTSFYNNICKPVIIPGIIDRGTKPFYGYQCFDYVLSTPRFTQQFDYLIYIDEDCFVTDIEVMMELLKEFIKGNYGFAGIPDGGVCCHRNHNPVSINTFFTLFNIKEIKKVYNGIEVNKTIWDDSLLKFKPDFLIHYKDEKFKSDLEQTIPYCKIVRDNPADVCTRHQIPWSISYDNFEPCYRIFFYLLKNGLKPLYINGGDSLIDDLGITTELNYNNKPFCYHTWFARLYSNDMNQKERIVKVFNKCTYLKKLIE